MNIAVIHFHLNRGGVTQAIVNHLKALDTALTRSDGVQVAVLYGGRKSGWPDDLARSLTNCRLRLQPVDGLEYDDVLEVDEGLAGALQAALDRLGFASGETILHVHNHSLGKNVSLPVAIRRLAEQGYVQLLQIHDFAEDFRGGNYRRMHQALVPRFGPELASALYPQAAGIHYATLTSKDFEILSNAGFPAGRLHLLPNPVTSPGTLPDRHAARRLFAERFGPTPRRELLLYPVRGIRRKNLGEALLWSTLAADSHRVAVTLSPLNPAERPSYERWRQLARQLDVPMLFGTGEKEGLSFLENLAAADKILTTSVAEGFGMVFLESWLVGRPLIGRDLTSVTRDFVDAGVRFDRLQPRLRIPLAWIDASQSREQLRELFLSALAGFDLDATRVRGREALAHLDDLMSDNHLDFAYLEVAQQEQIITSIRKDSRRREALIEANPWLDAALGWRPEEYGPLVESNARVIDRVYSLSASGPRLCDLYRSLLTPPRERAPFPEIDGDAILNAFLDLRRLYPLRMADDHL